MKVVVNKCNTVYTASVYDDSGKFTGKGLHFTNSKEAAQFKAEVESGAGPAWVYEPVAERPVCVKTESEPADVTTPVTKPEEDRIADTTPALSEAEDSQMKLSDFMPDIWDGREL